MLACTKTAGGHPELSRAPVRAALLQRVPPVRAALLQRVPPVRAVLLQRVPPVRAGPNAKYWAVSAGGSRGLTLLQPFCAPHLRFSGRCRYANLAGRRQQAKWTS